MKTEEMLRKIKSVKLCMMAHPDYEYGTEFEDRILDLQEIEDYLSELGEDFNNDTFVQ
jgi:hypothetical protein